MRRDRTVRATTLLAVVAVLIASSFALGAKAGRQNAYQVPIIHKSGVDTGGELKSIPCGALEMHLAHANWEEERTIAVAQWECREAGRL